MQRSVTLSPVCPPSSPGEAMQTLGLCAESEASKPVRADGLLSSWRNTQMVRTDITWSVNAYWHSMIQKNCGERRKISTDGGAVSASRATSAGARRLWGEKVTPASLGGDNLRGVFSFANLDYLGLGYWEEPKLPGDCFSGPGCRVLRCTHKPKDQSSLVQRASSVWPQANHATSRVLQSSLTTRLWDFN